MLFERGSIPVYLWFCLSALFSRDPIYDRYRRRHSKSRITCETPNSLAISDAVWSPPRAMATEAFNVDKLLSLLRTCRGEKGEILMDVYVDAFEELKKLLQLFGTVFGFVSSDVASKVDILRAYRSSGQAENYESIQCMLQYETENNLTVNKEKPSGARTLLRLHRSLEFITQFLEEVCNGTSSTKMATVSSQAYDRTLAKYHPWLIKKGAHIAFYTLPGRDQFLNRMMLHEEERAQTVLKEIISFTKEIYDATQTLYSDRKLLDLP